MRIGFERDLVAVAAAGEFERRWRAEIRAYATPGISIKIAHHRVAPTARRARRQRAIKAHAHRGLVGLGQLRDAARTHLLAQSGHGLVLPWHRPERAL